MFKLIIFGIVFITAVTARNGLIPMPDGRIVGGQETTIEHYPHQVSMRAFFSHRCGGSMIRENIVISAGHCVDGLLFPSYLKIRAGVTNKGDSGVSSWVQTIYLHENYNSATVDYDIAVLILTDKFTFTQQLQPIALPELHEELPAGSIATVTGWGATAEGGFGSNILKSVDVVVVDRDECKAAYSKFNEITQQMLCAGQIGGGSDACQGDSGGPFVAMSDKDNVTKLFGVVSWGYGCARPDYPGVYTNVASLRDWIDSKIELTV